MIVSITSPAVFVVEDVLTRRKETAPAAIAKTYAALKCSEAAPEEILDLADQSSALYDVAEQSMGK